jgi:hypothetical protein
VGEFFCLERSGIELSLDTHSSALGRQTLKNARLLVTTLRLCVIADKPNAAGLQAFDLPLAGISQEDFKQPIFVRDHTVALLSSLGTPRSLSALPSLSLSLPLSCARTLFLSQGANFLQCTVAPVPGRGLESPATAKLYFFSGGAGTFLRVFFALMDKYQRAPEPARAAWLAPAQMQSWMTQQTAYVDPSDPSRLFLAQPTVAQMPQQQGQQPAYSGGGPTPQASAPPGYSFSAH